VTVDAPDPVTVLGDPDQLRQLLANLTRNAVIHTPERTPIELSVTRGDGVATLTVRDHGPGLPPDAGDRLFDRFWRTQAGRSRGRAAPVWDWRSCARWPARMAARSMGRTRPAAARGSPSGCRSPRPRRLSQEILRLLTPDSYLNRGR